MLSVEDSARSEPPVCGKESRGKEMREMANRKLVENQSNFRLDMWYTLIGTWLKI